MVDVSVIRTQQSNPETAVSLCHSSTFVWINSQYTILTRDGTAEPVSRDQILRHEQGQGNIHFLCSADHEQDWQPYPVDTHFANSDGTYIHTCYIFFKQQYYIVGCNQAQTISAERFPPAETSGFHCISMDDLVSQSCIYQTPSTK